MRTLDRYLLLEVARPLFLFFFILTAIFAAYSASDFLGDAAQGLIRPDTIARLVLLKSVIAMEVLLPIATFLTVVMGLSRLGSTFEITAMSFCGYSRRRMLVVLSFLFTAVALLVALLSIWTRPRVYQEIYRLKREATRQLRLDDVEQGTFLQTDKGRTVIYVENQDDTDSRRGVFVFLDRPDRRLVLLARSLEQLESPDGDTELRFHDLEAWQLDGQSDDTMTMATSEISIPFRKNEATAPRRRRKATLTDQLNTTLDLEDLSEYQWRISRPFSTWMLGFLAFALANFVPRRDRYLRLLLAVVIYIIYFNLQAVARTWVENGLVPRFPGLFWVDSLLALILLAAFVRTRWQRRPGA